MTEVSVESDAVYVTVEIISKTLRDVFVRVYCSIGFAPRVVRHLLDFIIELLYENVLLILQIYFNYF